jgi:hypothetical protein
MGITVTLDIVFGRELVVLQTLSSMVGKLQCMVGGSVEVQLRSILYWFIGGQNYFGMPRGAKMSLALNELK